MIFTYQRLLKNLCLPPRPMDRRQHSCHRDPQGGIANTVIMNMLFWNVGGWATRLKENDCGSH